MGFWQPLPVVYGIDGSRMKISYKLFKSIHLYACLSTAAVLTMFVFTSYLMIHRDMFDHTVRSDTTRVRLALPLETETDWQRILDEEGIRGRLGRSFEEEDGTQVRQYNRAAGWTVLRAEPRAGDLQVIRHTESTVDALEGIHRQRGYNGPWQYRLYAFLLDLVGVSLILFTFTGVVMWFRLLKYNRLAWIIFLAGFVYVGLTLALLLYW